MTRIIKETVDKFEYAFVFPYNLETVLFCKQLKNKYGRSNIAFHYGKWRFTTLRIAEDIAAQYPDVHIGAELQDDYDKYELEKKAEAIKNKQIAEIKALAGVEFHVNHIKGNLRPYQKLGVKFMLLAEGRVILGDTMGLGKTAQSLAFIAHSAKQKSLVICPASVKYAWQNETKKWTKLRPLVMDGKTNLTADIFQQHDIFIINYDLLKKFQTVLSAYHFDCAVFDEFHYLKNLRAQRTKAAIAITQNIASKIMLSGTPILNKPVELFTALNMVDAFTWNDWYAYTKRYCGGHMGYFGYEANGATNIEELKDKISQYFLRRTKEEVLSELPPKIFTDIPIYLDNSREYQMAENDFYNYLIEIKDKKEEEISKNLALIKLNELKRLVSMGKISAAQEIITDAIEDGEKIVVFSNYNEPLERLKQTFGENACLLTGKVSDALERQQMIDDFQTKEQPMIFLGGMKSAGVGITLTRASRVLFIDYSWVPADHMQAVDRVHRIGQSADNILVYQIVSLNTIDEKLQAVLAEKKAIFEQLIDGKPVNQRQQMNMLSDVMKLYLKEATTK